MAWLAASDKVALEVSYSSRSTKVNQSFDSLLVAEPLSDMSGKRENVWEKTCPSAG